MPMPNWTFPTSPNRVVILIGDEFGLFLLPPTGSVCSVNQHLISCASHGSVF